MARKSKEFGYLLTQQKKSVQRQKNFEAFHNKLKQSPLPSSEFVLNPEGEAKMSEVLEDFIAPYKQQADSEEAMQKLLTVAVVAWNASFFSESEQQEQIETMLAEGMPGASEQLKTEFKDIVNQFISRKKRYFSEYKRLIIDFDLKKIGGKYHLSVASTASTVDEPSL